MGLAFKHTEFDAVTAPRGVDNINAMPSASDLSLPILRNIDQTSHWNLVSPIRSEYVFQTSNITKVDRFLNGGSQVVAGAMVAVTCALSPAAYASETQPKFDFIYLSNSHSESEQSPELDVVVARLAHLASKSPGWKGSDSLAMSPEVRIATKTFMKNYFSTKDMIEPFIGLDADGDVTLFWKNKNLIMDLSISESGLYSFYANLNGKRDYKGDDLSVQTPLPSDLISSLKRNA